MAKESTEEIKALLADLDFPASKEQIAEHARRKGGPGADAERLLAGLPLADYANVQEVLRSVPASPDRDRSETERVFQRRHHRKAGLAEHMREAELPPVEEELRGRPGGSQS